jgi:hypothetical membrane protein
MAGVGYLGAVILILSLAWTQYSPVTQVASDYGVGAFAPEMNAGFFLAGVGVISLAVAVIRSGATRGQKAGACLFLLDGLALAVNAFFQTDLEGAAGTLHGTIHAVGGVVFFFTSPVGILLVAHGFGRRWFRGALLSLALAVAALAGNGALGLNAGGLAERVLILVVFLSLILIAARIYREA